MRAPLRLLSRGRSGVARTDADPHDLAEAIDEAAQRKF